MIPYKEMAKIAIIVEQILHFASRAMAKEWRKMLLE